MIAEQSEDRANERETNRNLDDAGNRALEVLRGLLTRMGLEVEAKLEESEERVQLAISGVDAGELIGRRGQTLDALEYLVGRILAHEGWPTSGVTVDSDEYRKRREQSLIEMAQRLGEKAISEAKVVALNPMSPRDRRIIHVTLRDTPGLTTRSEGEGDERRLLIVPQIQ